MVKSGLDPKNFEGPSDVPRVSQYRLASHLSTAMVLYSVLFWSSLDILAPAKKPQLGQAILPAIKKIRGMTMGVKALVFLTAVSGAFVAGLVNTEFVNFIRKNKYQLLEYGFRIIDRLFKSNSVVMKNSRY